MLTRAKSDGAASGKLESRPGQAISWQIEDCSSLSLIFLRYPDRRVVIDGLEPTETAEGPYGSDRIGGRWARGAHEVLETMTVE
ncbi:MAG: hypothetical protein HQM08_14090 [Candidatus Riflebacteria bacterium]|nr:hypothetical protein [Candidatus Riflebacteria bacterium]